MKVLIPFALILATIADLLLYRGEHLAAIFHPISEMLGGIRTGGNIWGA